MKDKNTKSYCCFFNFIEDSEESDPKAYEKDKFSPTVGKVDRKKFKFTLPRLRFFKLKYVWKRTL